jgi:sulfoxide reductase catalytic subunit YedY
MLTMAAASSLGLQHSFAHADTAPFGKLLASPLSLSDDKPTAFKSVTTYGNFYEFGPDKDSPAKHAHRLRTRPWTVTVDGEVKTAKTFAIEDILNWAPLEERIYRMRCVEGWSAVIPWAGFSFNELLKRVEPTGNAKFVEFWSLADPEQMPYVRAPFLDWPYVEAIRLDEARHPLTLFALGMYGEVMPKQNGAPLRLVVPWKYGFKGAKSIVRIRFVEKQPETVWTKAAADEYGFYSNVNLMFPTSAGARVTNADSANSANAKHCRSMATPSRLPRFTPAWIYANTSDMTHTDARQLSRIKAALS